MKAYLITTGVIFGLVALAHIWRMVGGEASLAKDPVFILLTVTAVGLSLWAWLLLKRGARGQ